VLSSIHVQTLFVKPTDDVRLAPAQREVGAKVSRWWQGVGPGLQAPKNGGRGDVEDGGKVVGVEVGVLWDRM